MDALVAAHEQHAGLLVQLLELSAGLGPIHQKERVIHYEKHSQHFRTMPVFLKLGMIMEVRIFWQLGSSECRQLSK